MSELITFNLMISEMLNQVAISRLFSAKVIREMAMHGRSTTFSQLARESGFADSFPLNKPISSVFDEAFLISKNVLYRHEYVYKAAIVDKIFLGVHNLNTASMLTELRANNCRADVVVLNGTSTAYEIKSERDNLNKLETQISAYRSVFARVNVIAAHKHIDSILHSVPPDVGVQVLSKRYQISTIREAVTDPHRVSPTSIFESLQIIEAKEIAIQLGIDIPDIPNTKMHLALKELFKNLDPAEVHHEMVNVLKRTRSLRQLSTLIESLPKSLRTAAMTVKLTKKDQLKLISAMEVKLGEALKWS